MNPISDIILPFVANYDVPYKYDDAISHLWKARAFSIHRDLGHCPTDHLATYVGAQYCAMVREDVNYRLPEGMQHARRSRRAADELANRLNQSLPETGINLQDATYILVRWHDAFGRLLYRTGNYALARVEFSQALRFMDRSRHDFLWCRYDIESNLQRTKFEIDFQVENHKQDAESIYQNLIHNAEQAKIALRTESDPVKQIELRRSVVNCLHNSLRCRQAAEKAREEGVSNKKRGIPSQRIRTASETIEEARTFAEGDPYRTAQLLNEEGQALMRSDPSKALEVYKQLSSYEWPRGHFFAQQNTAIIQSDATMLLELCEQIELDQRENGSFDVMDLDRYDWTLSRAESLEPAMNEQQQLKLLKQQDAITNAVSRVISIASYRSQFEKKIRKRLRKLASTRVAKYMDQISMGSKHFIRDRSQHLDELVDGLEGFAAKEVLEVLRANRSRKYQAKQEDSKYGFLISVEEQAKHSAKPPKISQKSITKTASPLQSMPSILGLADSGIEGRKELEELAAKAREADERYWLDNPLAIQDSTGSPSLRAHQITASEPHALLLKYCITQAASDAKDKQIIAIWWFRGRSGLVKLPATAVACAEFIANPNAADVQPNFYSYENLSTRIPKLKLAEHIWNCFLVPVLEDIAKIHKAPKIHSLTIVLEAELYHIPFNLAWVPADCKLFGVNDQPLAMSCNLSFALNLTSHLLDARRELNQCYRLPEEDELIVLKHSSEFDADGVCDFDGPGKMEAIREAVEAWGNRAQIPGAATREIVATCLSQRAEFLMFACHGERLSTGPVLHLENCRLVSYNLAYNVALNGNKLLVLGACDSATPDTESYGRFIGAFVAAGAGAILANPCKALIFTVCKVPAMIFHSLVQSDSLPVDFAEELKKATHKLSEWYKSELNGKFSEVDFKLWASTYQLWL